MAPLAIHSDFSLKINQQLCEALFSHQKLGDISINFELGIVTMKFILKHKGGAVTTELRSSGFIVWKPQMCKKRPPVRFFFFFLSFLQSSNTFYIYLQKQLGH